MDKVLLKFTHHKFQILLVYIYRLKFIFKIRNLEVSIYKKTPNKSNKQRKGLKISQLIIVSLRKHRIEVDQLMNEYQLDILGLNETRLHR